MEKVILAYSGGLDTSVAIKWLNETYHLDVIAVTVDVGNERDFQSIQEKALRTGATKAFVHDAKDDFVRFFAFPSLQAGAIYEERYPLATALARPLIAKVLVDYARQEGATHIAHGCTGKGNDQVRFDVSINALAPDIKIVAPVREWRWTREEEILYANEHDIPVPVTVGSPYSVDQNLWGRSIEAGILEDAWAEPPEDAYAWTMNPRHTPDEPSYVEIELRHGIPVAVDGAPMEGVDLILRLNDLAGSHGVGRIDHIENRFVGIKSREIYECPAAIVLHTAHAELEKMTLTRDQMRFKQVVSQELANLIYNGFWFSAHTQDLMSYVASTQRYVTGTVRLRLFKGSATAVGRKAEHSLYNEALATYGSGDLFDHNAALGFISLVGLPMKNQARSQLLLDGGSADEMMRLAAGQREDDEEEGASEDASGG
ncbi:MAG: argininosuccinate synthase [Chloroflexi bacterium]|nr:argininosuccinate synthase [Chloroflexota bacterium]